MLEVPSSCVGHQNVAGALRQIHGTNPLPDNVVDDIDTVVPAAAPDEQNLQANVLRHRRSGALALHTGIVCQVLHAIDLQLSHYTALRVRKRIAASPPLTSTRVQDNSQRISDVWHAKSRRNLNDFSRFNQLAGLQVPPHLCFGVILSEVSLND